MKDILEELNTAVDMQAVVADTGVETVVLVVDMVVVAVVDKDTAGDKVVGMDTPAVTDADAADNSADTVVDIVVETVVLVVVDTAGDLCQTLFQESCSTLPLSPWQFLQTPR